MSTTMTVTVHAIAEDGIPDMADPRMVGRTAFIFDGCIVSGWPLHADAEDFTTPYSGQWEADSDVGRTIPFAGVTHWIEFPAPVWEIERAQIVREADPPGDQPLT